VRRLKDPTRDAEEIRDARGGRGRNRTPFCVELEGVTLFRADR
jgi:hypothetical protein